MRPILLNSCARAATAAEARYRIDAAIAPSRGVRVLALDRAAVAVVALVERRSWASARFFASVASGRLRRIGGSAGGSPRDGARVGAGDGARVGAGEGAGGSPNGDGSGTSLDAALDGADVVVMVATTADGAEQASAVGSLCVARGIMTAGLVLGGGERPAAVAVLRPYVRVILVTDDEADVAEVLTALRA